MITIMAIDQSLTSTGIVIMEAMPHMGDSGFRADIVAIGTIPTKKVSDDFVADVHARSMHIGERLNELIAEHQPTHIIFETPSLASKGNATRSLPMLLGSLLAQLPDDIQIHHLSPMSLKKFATGSGNAKKDDMVEAIKDTHLGLHEEIMAMPKSKGRYDIADAFWLAHYLLSCVDLTEPDAITPEIETIPADATIH